MLVLILFTKEWLTLLNGELGEHRTCPKDLPVATNIVTIWERILQFFSQPFMVSWHACTRACITSLLAGVILFCGHFILTVCLWWPSSASTEMASMKAQTHFRWVSGLMAPLDVPTTAQTGPDL